MNTTGRQFRCTWREPFYNADAQVVGLSWFTMGRGYDAGDVTRVAALDVGQSVELDIGGHTVERIS